MNLQSKWSRYPTLFRAIKRASDWPAALPPPKKRIKKATGRRPSRPLKQPRAKAATTAAHRPESWEQALPSTKPDFESLPDSKSSRPNAAAAGRRPSRPLKQPRAKAATTAAHRPENWEQVLPSTKPDFESLPDSKSMRSSAAATGWRHCRQARQQLAGGTAAAQTAD